MACAMHAHRGWLQRPRRPIPMQGLQASWHHRTAQEESHQKHYRWHRKGIKNAVDQEGGPVEHTQVLINPGRVALVETTMMLKDPKTPDAPWLHH